MKIFKLFYISMFVSLFSVGCGDNHPDPKEELITQCRSEATEICDHIKTGRSACYYAFASGCSEEDEKAARELCESDPRVKCLGGLPYWN